MPVRCHQSLTWGGKGPRAVNSSPIKSLAFCRRVFPGEGQPPPPPRPRQEDVTAAKRSGSDGSVTRWIKCDAAAESGGCDVLSFRNVARAAGGRGLCRRARQAVTHWLPRVPAAQALEATPSTCCPMKSSSRTGRQGAPGGAGGWWQRISLSGRSPPDGPRAAELPRGLRLQPGVPGPVALGPAAPTPAPGTGQRERQPFVPLGSGGRGPQDQGVW